MPDLIKDLNSTSIDNNLSNLSDFSKSSTSSNLSNLSKKSELVREGMGIALIIKTIFLLLLFGFILVVYLEIPFDIVAILIGTEIFVTLVAGYIKIKKLSVIHSIGTKDAKNYRILLIANEFYGFLTSIFGVIANTISVVIIFMFFSNEISHFIITNIPASIANDSYLLKYFILIFVFSRMFEFIVRLLGNSWTNRIKENIDITVVDQEYVLIQKKLEIAKFTPVMSLVVYVLFLFGIQVYIPITIAFVMMLMIALSVFEFKRMKAIFLETNVLDSTFVANDIDEKKV